MSDGLEILLADDHAVFLDALAAVLTQMGHHIVATATTAAALLSSVRAIRPDLCVTETKFLDGYAADVVGRISITSPDTRVVALTSDGDPAMLRRVLDAGAHGYVHKSRGLVVLVDVLRRVNCGEVVIEGSFVRPKADDRKAPLELARLASFLTQRERECLAMLVAGLDTAAISRRLGVTRTTVRSHVQAILTKLGVHSRLEAVALATRYNLLKGLDRADVDPRPRSYAG